MFHAVKNIREIIIKRAIKVFLEKGGVEYYSIWKFY